MKWNSFTNLCALSASFIYKWIIKNKQGEFMKKLFFAVVLLLSTNAFAEMVQVKKVKCTLFGNLKVKVRGLESFGNVGEGYLRANLPMRRDCDAVASEFSRTMGRGVQAVTVDFDRYEIQRQISRGSDRDKTDYECEVYLRSSLSVNFPRFGSTEFKNTHEKFVTRYYGRCR